MFSIITKGKQLQFYGFSEIAILWHFLSGNYREVNFFKDSAQSFAVVS